LGVGLDLRRAALGEVMFADVWLPGDQPGSPVRGQAVDDAGEPLELSERPTMGAAALRLLLQGCRDSNGLGDSVEDR
jgi:hypothetical protein